VPIAQKPVLIEKEWQSTVDGKRMMDSVKRLLDIGTRVAGSEGSIRAQQMIKAELGAAGITDVREQKFKDATPKGEKNFANIIGVLPGKQKEGIALAAHYDSKLFEEFKFLGANDAASAVAVLFELARKLKPGAADREITYYFIFFDGEEAFNEDWREWERDTAGEKQDHTYGSRYFVRKMDEEGYPIKALVLLDLVGDKDYSLSEHHSFSRELLAIFKNASKEVFGVDFFVQWHQELGDDHDPFVEKGIPAIDLIDFEYGRGGSLEYWHTQEDTIDKLSERSLERTGTLVLKALPEVENMVVKGLKAGATTKPK
jgi:Zn-dependent M28 family amino/carboxypeptidase